MQRGGVNISCSVCAHIASLGHHTAIIRKAKQKHRTHVCLKYKDKRKRPCFLIESTGTVFPWQLTISVVKFLLARREFMVQFSFKWQPEPGHWSQLFWSSGRTDCHLRSHHLVVVSVSTWFSLEFYQPWSMTLLRKEIRPHYYASLAFCRHITKSAKTPRQELFPHIFPPTEKKDKPGGYRETNLWEQLQKGLRHLCNDMFSH